MPSRLFHLAYLIIGKTSSWIYKLRIPPHESHQHNQGKYDYNEKAGCVADYITPKQSSVKHTTKNLILNERLLGENYRSDQHQKTEYNLLFAPGLALWLLRIHITIS